MREELFWDRNKDQASPEIVIESAITFQSKRLWTPAPRS